MSERDEPLYLTDIVEAIGQILGYTSAGRDAFFCREREIARAASTVR